MIQDLNDTKAQNKNKSTSQLINQKQSRNSKTKQGNIFERKISKNIHSIIVGYLSFRDIMRLKLVNQYNRNLILTIIGLTRDQEFYDTYGGFMDSILPHHRLQLTQGNLKEFFNIKNPNGITNDIKIALFKLVNNTVKVDYHYDIWINQSREQFDHKHYPIVFSKVISLTVLNQIRTILTEENQKKIQCQAANSVFIFLKGVVNSESQEPLLKATRDIKEVENNIKLLLKAKQ